MVFWTLLVGQKIPWVKRSIKKSTNFQDPKWSQAQWAFKLHQCFKARKWFWEHKHVVPVACYRMWYNFISKYLPCGFTGVSLDTADLSPKPQVSTGFGHYANIQRLVQGATGVLEEIHCCHCSKSRGKITDRIAWLSKLNLEVQYVVLIFLNAHPCSRNCDSI